MKTIGNKIVLTLGIVTLASLLESGCVVQPDGRVGVGVAVEPAVTVDTAVPDDYVWDGYEYVGVVGDQYYYLLRDVWIVADPALHQSLSRLGKRPPGLAYPRHSQRAIPQRCAWTGAAEA